MQVMFKMKQTPSELVLAARPRQHIHGDDAEPFVEVGSRRTIATNVPMCELLHCLSAVWRVD